MFIYYLVLAAFLADPKSPITFDAPAARPSSIGFEPVPAKPKISFEYDEPPEKPKQTTRQVMAFGAPWCVYCLKPTGPAVVSLKSAGWLITENPKEQAHILLVNVEASKQLAETWKVPDTPLPVFVLVENGQEVLRHVGKLSANEVSDFYNRVGKFDPQLVAAPKPKQALQAKTRVSSVITWPGGTEASLREHLKGAPHFVDTTQMSFQQMVEFHDAWHLAHPEHTNLSGASSRTVRRRRR